MNVCEILLDLLDDYGVKYIFGIPGDAINELTEAIRKQKRIKFIHVMHEESGAFAASAQAKLTGNLAVCVGTAGPGAIHLLNGLYDAKMDHAPVLAITGQVETGVIGRSYQQEVNLQALFQDVSVYNQTIFNAEQMPEAATLAIQTALIRRGVSHLSIPSNISKLKVPDYKKKKQIFHSQSLNRPSFNEIKRAAELLNASKKPCILAGIGAAGAVPELLKLAGLIKAPIIKALRGKDIIPDNHPMTLGGTGLLGTEASVKATNECDLFFVVGSDFPYAEFYPTSNARTIQIDRDGAHIGRRHPVDVALVGDTKLTLSELIPLLAEKRDDSFLKHCQGNMASWRKKQEKLEHSNDLPIHPQTLARTISDLSASDAIVVCDTGAVTLWGARNFQLKEKQRFTLSGALASMAYGMSAAIGAKLLFPEKQVIALCGDGGFAMLMCDFATAVKYKLAIKVFIFNNSKLGLIQMEQEARAGHPEYETELHNPDYTAFALACGGEGFTIKHPNELTPTLTKVFASNKPCLINVFVNPEELTMPPSINKSEVWNYLHAKVTEFFTAN